jgi:carboxylesterase type B
MAGIRHDKAPAELIEFLAKYDPAIHSLALGLGQAVLDCTHPGASRVLCSSATAAGAPAQQSEDCLVLNIFTPGVNDNHKRPVIVWLHGGGFSSGSGSGRILDGTSLAHTHDVVVVTLNHRLNVFGFTYVGDAMGSGHGS